MKAFFNTTNGYGLTPRFVKYECVRTSGTKFARCLWLAYVNNAEVLECGVQAKYILDLHIYRPVTNWFLSNHKHACQPTNMANLGQMYAQFRRLD